MREPRTADALPEPEALLTGLEPSQLVARRRPFGRRKLARRHVLLLTVLRVYVIVAVVLVVYAFWRALHA